MRIGLWIDRLVGGRFFAVTILGLFLILVLPFAWSDSALGYGFIAIAAYAFLSCLLSSLPENTRLLWHRLLRVLSLGCLLSFAAGGSLWFWHYWVEGQPIVAGAIAAVGGYVLAHWNPLVPEYSRIVAVQPARGYAHLETPGGRAARDSNGLEDYTEC